MAEERRDTTLLDLFYGMERHLGFANGCVLDSIPGVLKLEINSIWMTKDDDEQYQYPSSFCIYVDSVFPSKPVAETVSSLLETEYVKSFVSYLTDEEKRLTHSEPVADGRDILANARSEFAAIDKALKKPMVIEPLPEIFPFRTSFVACRVYGNDDITTYLIEGSVDYNGSKGCPSSADYVTVDNRTGKILKYEDIVGKGMDSQVNTLLYEEYSKQYRMKNHSEPLDIDFMKFSPKDNCAIVKEGILFYYHPYEIGCGAEGQYNLIINL